jgi:hypothetical protein
MQDGAAAIVTATTGDDVVPAYLTASILVQGPETTEDAERRRSDAIDARRRFRSARFNPMTAYLLQQIQPINFAPAEELG